jgi:PAS domain S-box-containing protein
MTCNTRLLCRDAGVQTSGKAYAVVAMTGHSGEGPLVYAAPLPDSDARLRTFITAAEDYAIVGLDAAGLVTDWNVGAERLLRWTENEVVGKPAAAFLPATEIAANAGAAARCLRRDGSSFDARVSITALHDLDGCVHAHVAVIRDITGSILLIDGEVQLESWSRIVIESAMDAIITVDAAQRIIVFNKAAEAMFHASAAEVFGESLDRFIPHRLRGSHARHVAGFGATGVTSRTMGHPGTLSGLRSDGSEFPLEASISQAEVDGKKLFTVIVRDVTQRKHAEEHQSLLLLELAHRVRNTLAIVQSQAAHTRRFATPETFHDALTGRLMALGGAYDLLSASEWAGAALADVIRFALAPCTGPEASPRWCADGPAIWLAANEAVTMTLIFHELTSNSIKYGAFSSEAGHVAVTWRLDSEIEPVTLTILWRESDGPAVAEPTRSGFGSRFVVDAIKHELGGGSTLVFPAGGVECRMRVPLSKKITVR